MTSSMQDNKSSHVEYGRRAEVALGSQSTQRNIVMLGFWEVVDDERRRQYTKAMTFFLKGLSQTTTDDTGETKKVKRYRSPWEVPSPPVQLWRLAINTKGNHQLANVIECKMGRHVERAKKPIEKTNTKEYSCHSCGSSKHSQNHCPLMFCGFCKKYGHKETICRHNQERNMITETKPNPTKKRNSVRLFDFQRRTKMIKLAHNAKGPITNSKEPW